jgi:metal-dependent HD superfamily phosphatase/phosphodiesterase
VDRHSLALLPRTLDETVKPLAQLLVGGSLHRSAQAVEGVRVVKGQLGPVAVGSEVEVCGAARDRQLERFIDIHREAFVRYVPLDALVDGVEGREVAVPRCSLAHRTC